MVTNPLPRLKFVNGWVLVVLGVELPISSIQARSVFDQLRGLQEVAA